MKISGNMNNSNTAGEDALDEMLSVTQSPDFKRLSMVPEVHKAIKNFEKAADKLQKSHR